MTHSVRVKSEHCVVGYHNVKVSGSDRNIAHIRRVPVFRPNYDVTKWLSDNAPSSDYSFHDKMRVVKFKDANLAFAFRMRWG